jgi:hypothetical protein
MSPVTLATPDTFTLTVRRIGQKTPERRTFGVKRRRWP